MKRRRTVALLLSIAAAATMMLISAPPSQADTYLGNVVIRNVDSHLCVSLNPQNLEDFNVVDTIDCTSISNEKWSLNLSGTTQIASLISSGGYPLLDVFEDLPNPGNTLDVFHDDRTGAQFFEIVHL